MSKIETLDGVQIPGPFDVEQSTDLAVAALGSMFKLDRLEVREQILGHMADLHAHLVELGGKDDVEPFESIQLSQRLGLGTLLQLYSRGAKENHSVASEFWNRYSVDELNRHTQDEQPTGPVDGVVGHARAMITNNAKSGLYLGDEREDRIALSKWEFMTPADYIMICAQRREQGLALPDYSTATDFIQFEPSPSVRRPKDLHIPIVSTERNDHISFTSVHADGSKYDEYGQYIGVRATTAAASAVPTDKVKR